MVNFTIQGLATDAPVANATITGTMGGITATTTADAQGRYQLAFEYEKGSLSGSEMVRLNAKGEGEQSHIELVSQLGSLATLGQQAGDDAVLAQTESSRTTITQLSTALHLLSQDTGLPLTSDAKLAEAESLVNAETVLELAAIIKVLADNPDYTPEQGTILDALSSNQEGVQASVDDYLVQQGLMDEAGEYTEEFADAVEAAEAATLADPAVTPGFSTEELTGINVLTNSVTPGWTEGQGSMMRLHEGGGASLTNPTSFANYMEDDVDGSWQLSDQGQLVIQYGDNQSTLYEYPSYEEVAERWGQQAANALQEYRNSSYNDEVIVHSSYKQSEIIRLTTGTLSKVAVSTEIEYTLDLESLGITWNGELPTATEASDSVQTWRIGAGHSSLWSQAPSGHWALPIPAQLKGYFDTAPQDYRVHQHLVLSDEGAMLTPEGESMGQWSFAQGELVLSTNEGWRVTVLPYNQVDGLYSALVRVEQGDFQYSAITWIAQYQQSDSTLEADLIQPAPHILSAEINSWIASVEDDTKTDVSYLYGYGFNEDGSLIRVSGHREKDDQGMETGNSFFGYDEAFHQWSQEGNYHYRMLGEIDWGNGDLTTRNRSWEVIASLSGGRHLVLEQSTWTYDSLNDSLDESSIFIFPRINVLTSRDLSQWQAAYQYSEEICSLPWFGCANAGNVVEAAGKSIEPQQ
ncbi:carboxypeptidase-like regulatory domain-containing protein [Ferrimonas sp. SCSIO 43195]|uniref:carboxypeptidase-like regulatory domain-containing protein n=1 Tax=Ferrimonas sp. SCSIO 43195 TaxID=2822844 RepID=UPI0020762CD1|nr:carboxypeptidase-like regulatory domain-containing protein [Ferrimonas sp. SCSIO 43195]USD36081.1 carboxypeptidase regulatory-like domain-containing protein [Ferrimonas sp. SCSIO 43195]